MLDTGSTGNHTWFSLFAKQVLSFTPLVGRQAIHSGERERECMCSLLFSWLVAKFPTLRQDEGCGRPPSLTHTLTGPDWF